MAMLKLADAQDRVEELEAVMYWMERILDEENRVPNAAPSAIRPDLLKLQDQFKEEHERPLVALEGITVNY